jgi:hypothetical protein
MLCAVQASIYRCAYKLGNEFIIRIVMGCVFFTLVPISTWVEQYLIIVNSPHFNFNAASNILKLQLFLSLLLLQCFY